MKNNWYVITGASSSGKTTVINLLKEMSFTVACEVSRNYIDKGMKKGKTLNEIRGAQTNFDEKILDLQIESENNLPKDKVIFFDRAIPDNYAYLKFHDVKDYDLLRKASSDCEYKKVFLLDPLDYEKDYARTGDSKQQESMHKLLKEVYSKIGSSIVRVPVMSPEERVQFILNNLE